MTKEKPKTILIIEDDTQTRSLLHTAFTHEGFQVTEASNGMDGLKSAQEHNFICIVTDLKMPKMNGLELIENLVKIPTIKDGRCHVIVYSNIGQDYAVKEALKKGATRVVHKDDTTPIKLAQIVTKLVN